MIVIRQAGVIPYRTQQGEIEILLITSASGKRWIIPKGMIDFFMRAADAAAKEAWEEAGIVGTVKTPAIGSYRSRKWNLPCRVEVFLMSVAAVQDDFPEANFRQRQWFDLPTAIQQVKEPELKSLLASLPTLALT